MKCEDIRRHFSEYIDLEAPQEIAMAIEEHVATCGDCRDELEAYRHFNAAISSVGEEELPFDFAVTLRCNLEEENQKHQHKRPATARPWFKVLAACACLILVIGVFSLGINLFGFSAMGAATESVQSTSNYGADSASFATMDSAPMESEAPAADSMLESGMEGLIVSEETNAPESKMDRSSPVGKNAAIERKIIKNYNLSVQVDDLDAAYEEISSLATEYSGYVVSGESHDYEGSTYQECWLSIRVDADLVDTVIGRISDLGNVENNSFTTNDITTEYYDIQTRLEQYRAQEARLMELYAQAETIQDLISLESELTRVTGEIESLEGSIRYYDQLTALSLIDIYLYTPNAYTQTVEPTGWAGFFANLKSGFLRGLNGLLDGIAGFFIFLVRILPAVVLILILVVVVWLIFRKGRKNRRRKKINA